MKRVGGELSVAEEDSPLSMKQQLRHLSEVKSEFQYIVC